MTSQTPEQREAIALLQELLTLGTDEGGKGYTQGMIARIQRDPAQATPAYIEQLRKGVLLAQAEALGLDVEPERVDIDMLSFNVGAILDMPAEQRSAAVDRLNNAEPLRLSAAWSDPEPQRSIDELGARGMLGSKVEVRLTLDDAADLVEALELFDGIDEGENTDSERLRALAALIREQAGQDALASAGAGIARAAS